MGLSPVCKIFLVLLGMGASPGRGREASIVPCTLRRGIYRNMNRDASSWREQALSQLCAFCSPYRRKESANLVLIASALLGFSMELIFRMSFR